MLYDFCYLYANSAVVLESGLKTFFCSLRLSWLHWSLHSDLVIGVFKCSCWSRPSYFSFLTKPLMKHACCDLKTVASDCWLENLLISFLQIQPKVSWHTSTVIIQTSSTVSIIKLIQITTAMPAGSHEWVLHYDVTQGALHHEAFFSWLSPGLSFIHWFFTWLIQQFFCIFCQLQPRVWLWHYKDSKSEVALWLCDLGYT